MSVLDDRIRNIARDEVGKFVTADPSEDAAPGTDRVIKLETQLAALTARVDELEKANTPAPTTKRTTSRKTPETTE